MKFDWRNPFCIFGLVLLWRVLLLVFTVQPIPANDAFFFDGPVRNWIMHGHYYNPSIVGVFPISGGQVFSAYPPLYQGALTVWMLVFGTSIIAAMALHLGLFAASGLITLLIVRKFYPAAIHYALVAWFFWGFTFGDRPESLAHVFGLMALLLTVKNYSPGPTWRISLITGGVLLLALYTSVIVGTLYFGIALVTTGLGWLVRRKLMLFVPFVFGATLFVAITFAIAKTEPLIWAGFLENARQTPLLAVGFHRPTGDNLIKLVHAAPVFLLAGLFVPLAIKRRRELFNGQESWPFLQAGIFVFGWVLLALSLTILSPYYGGYVMFAQIILAAGLLVLNERFSLLGQRCLRWCLVGCVLLGTMRTIGMTTWGAACAVENSYWRTQQILQVELIPFTRNNTPVVVSSAFLYQAQTLGVRVPVYADWFFDRSNPAPDTNLASLRKLRPTKMVLTQFEYYRGLVQVLDKLRQHSDQVEIRVRDLSRVRTPDSIPAMQRVVPHISWAPVIVDLDWKTNAPDMGTRP